MKHKLMALCIIVAVLAISATGTLAFFTATETAQNVVSAGGIDVAIVQKTTGADDVLTDVPKDGFKDVMPGDTVPMSVSVSNTGASAFWVRIAIEQRITAIDGSALPTELNGGVQVMSFDIDNTRWTYRDGWYYCTQPVNVGAISPQLLENVFFAPQMGNDFLGCTISLTFTTQAVQSAHNGATVFDAIGWT